MQFSSIACSGKAPATLYAVRSLGDLLVSLRISQSTQYSDRAMGSSRIDEAHRLRNVYKSQSTMAGRITAAIRPAHKLLLTATHYKHTDGALRTCKRDRRACLRDANSFRDQFVKASNEGDRNSQLRSRLAPVCIRTLRKQVIEYILTRTEFLSRKTSRQVMKNMSFTRAFNLLQRDNLISSACQPAAVDNAGSS